MNFIREVFRNTGIMVLVLCMLVASVFLIAGVPVIVFGYLVDDLHMPSIFTLPLAFIYFGALVTIRKHFWHWD